MKKSKYQIRIDGELVEVEAVEFDIFGRCALIVHRDHMYPKLWTVSEPRTGMSVVSNHSTRKSAMEAAALTVLEHREADIRCTVNKYVQTHRDTPTRYQEEYAEQWEKT